MKISNQNPQLLYSATGNPLINESPSMHDNSHSQFFFKVENKEKVQVGSLQNGQITKFQFEKIIKIQSALSFTIAISMFLIISAMEIEYSQKAHQHRNLIIFCLAFNSASTVIAMIISIIRFMAMLNLQKNRKEIYQNSTLFTTKKIFYVILECLIIIIQPYPFFMDIFFQTKNAYRNITFLFPLNDLLAMISLVRTYIIFRGLLLLTPYMNNRSNRLCKMYGCRANFSFSLKCLFKDNPLLLILILFTASSLIFSYAVYLAQRNTNPLLCDIDATCSYANALWLILMTITTVGYGDYYPQTPLGRMIVFLVAIWGTFIISIMVVVVSNTLKMQKKQKQASIVIRKLAVRQDVRKVAAKFVGYFILKIMAQKHQDKSRAQKYGREGKKIKKQFSQLRKQLKGIRNDNDLYDEIASKFLNLNNDIDILNSNQQKIISYIHDQLEYHEPDRDHYRDIHGILK